MSQCKIRNILLKSLEQTFPINPQFNQTKIFIRQKPSLPYIAFRINQPKFIPIHYCKTLIYKQLCKFRLFLIMEELLSHPIISLTLSPTFDPEQWHLITREKAPLYQNHLRELSHILENSMPILATQYYRFVQNTNTLTHWYHQNPHLQYQIQKYLFTSGPTAARQDMVHTSSAPKRTQTKKVKNYFAETLNLPPSYQTMQVEPVDSYGLYMQTLSACRGKHYAAYDYERHMKSSEERKKYNDFIRSKHKKHFTSLPHKGENSLQNFQEWQRKHLKKASLVNVRMILSDLTLNNEKGINQLLKKQGASKLVLLNHQRKPINYYLRIKNRHSQNTAL